MPSITDPHRGGKGPIRPPRHRLPSVEPQPGRWYRERLCSAAYCGPVVLVVHREDGSRRHAYIRSGSTVLHRAPRPLASRPAAESAMLTAATLLHVEIGSALDTLRAAASRPGRRRS